MGTFGTGNFENDSALDWLVSFKSKRSLASLRKTLRMFEKEQGENGAEEALACCEIVAAVCGHPSEEFDPDLEEWADKQRQKLDSELIGQAIAAVKRIARDSKLKNCWGESDSLKEWENNQRRLLARLQSKPLKPGNNKERKAPIIEIEGSETGLSPRRFRVGRVLPDLAKKVPGVGRLLNINLSIAQDISAAELKVLCSWLKKYPNVCLFLRDYPKPKKMQIAPKFLHSFSERKELILALETIKSLVPLESFRNLRSLDLRGSKAERPFTSLAALPKLKKLSLYEHESKHIAADFQNLALFKSLKSLNVSYMKTGFSSEENTSFDYKLEVESLPVLPKCLRSLALTSVFIKSLVNLEEARSLRKIDLSACGTETRVLDLGDLRELSRFELDGFSGLKEIVLSKNLRSLQLENVHGLRAKLPIADSLLALRISADVFSEGSCKRLAWPKLRMAKLSGVRSFKLAEELGKAPVLESLSFDGGRGIFPDLRNLKRLRFLTIDNFDGNPKSIKNISLIKNIEELILFYDLESKRRTTKKDFTALKGHPSLKRILVSALNFDEEEELLPWLGLKAYSEEEALGPRFLEDLEAELEEDG